MNFRFLLLIPALLLQAACREDAAAAPEPATMTADAVGYFCQMNIIEHSGPKAQIFLKDNPNALFFGQVRDAIAFRRMPEQAGEVTAFYVSDMGSAPDWDNPGVDNWIAADSAFYVMESSRMGGMGMPEAIPFSDRGKADAFAGQNGGKVVALKDITDAEVLGPSNGMAADGSAGHRMSMPDATGTGGADYADRLRNLDNDTETN